MNKRKLIEVTKEQGIFASKKEAEEKLEKLFQIFTDRLTTEGNLDIVGFGSLRVTTRKGKNNVVSHLKTVSGLVNVPETKNVKFKIGKSLKDKLNNK